jgi:class 3 adenylate cyclase
MSPKHTRERSGAAGARLHRLTDQPGCPEPGERELTVMFTDIAGFTRLAETLSPTQVARLLSGHFLALAHCIERERGRIHKIMGDGLIAVWAHPVGSTAATAPAMRASLAIRLAVETDNAAGPGRGLPPLRLRVGLHAGPLIAARLDSAGRLGVALCGDTVNVAQRLEDAGRGMAANGAVTIVASDAVVRQAGPGFHLQLLGELPVRGRTLPVRAFQVEGPDPAVLRAARTA